MSHGPMETNKLCPDRIGPEYGVFTPGEAEKWELTMNNELSVREYARGEVSYGVLGV